MYRPEGYQEILARTMGAIAPIDAKLVEAGADAIIAGINEWVRGKCSNGTHHAYHINDERQYCSNCIGEFWRGLNGKS